MNIMKRAYGLGRDDFKDQIESGCFYLDKSLVIREFLAESDKVVFVTRPRRFGKSLNMSMLNHFFDVKEKSKKLFESLAISKDATSMEYMNKYPIINLSFKGLRVSSLRVMMQGIRAIISAEYKRHVEVKTSLNEDELKRFKAIESRSFEEDDNLWGRSLLELSQYLEKYHGKKVLILIDEYDNSMNHVYEQKAFQDSTHFFKLFYVNALKDNSSLEKAFITGIMKVAEDEIFSKLDNLAVHTVLSEKYREYYGFTEEEIKPLIEEEGLSIDEARQWYNGHNFGGVFVYNPWTIINYLKLGEAQPYWVDTSSNDSINELVSRGGPEIKNKLELMLRGESVDAKIRQNVNPKELLEEDIWSILLQAGYLTYESREDGIALKLPNKEVRDFMDFLVRGINEAKSTLGLAEAIGRALRSC